MGSSRFKFRAWEGEIEKMYYITPMWRLESLTEGPYWKVMQFTGLLDKQGKEIYEGDILSFVPIYDKQFKKPYKPFEVYWLYNEARFNSCHPREGDNSPEIIGNIYENPELLEAK